MPSITTVLFDLGGTLIYFDGKWPQVFSRSSRKLLAHLQAAGVDLQLERFQAELRRRMEQYYAQRETEFIEYTTAYIVRQLLAEWGYPEVSEATLRSGLKAMYSVSQSHWHPEADAVPTLETLRAQGYHLGLISNAGDDADVQALVDKARLRPYFDIILTSAAEGIRKPNPRIFHQALEHWGEAPSRAAMVGDTLGADILGAHNAGVASIWITRRADNPANRAHGDTIRPQARIAALDELPALLARL